MLSYRHGFHAGNFADVHKHVVLVSLLQALKRKENPYCYLETHAGAGFYDLQGAFASKKREFEDGIGRLWGRDDLPSVVAGYVQTVRAANVSRGMPGHVLRYYPGSPWIARQYLRPQDRMVLMELHSSEAPELAREFGRSRRVQIEERDGYAGLKAHVPPIERRGLVLIDPAYERRNEFDLARAALVEGWQRWGSGTFALWYPVLTRPAIEQFHRAIAKSGIQKVLVCELVVRSTTVSNRLNGSGLVVINPPWKLDELLHEAVTWLATVLQQDDTATTRVDWLVPE